MLIQKEYALMVEEMQLLVGAVLGRFPDIRENFIIQLYPIAILAFLHRKQGKIRIIENLLHPVFYNIHGNWEGRRLDNLHVWEILMDEIRERGTIISSFSISFDYE